MVLQDQLVISTGWEAVHGGPGVPREKPPGGEVSSGKSKRRVQHRVEEVHQVRRQEV